MTPAEVSEEELWAELDDAQGRRRAEVLLELADRSYHRDDMSQFASLVDAAAVAAEEAEEYRLAAFARFNQAQGLMETGHPDEAADHFLAAAGFFHTIGDQSDIALSNQRAGDAFAATDRESEALERWQDALRVYEQEEDDLSQGRVHMALGNHWMHAGMPAEAVEAFQAARSRFRSHHSAHHVAWADDATAEGLIQQGQAEAAVPLLRSCLDIASVGSDDTARAYAALRLGLVLRILGEHTEALSNLKAARDDYQSDDNLMGVARCDLEAANALRALDELEDAESLYLGARSVFDALGADDYLLLADRQRASMYSDLGRTAEAVGLARATLARAEEVGERRIINDVVPRLADDLMDLGESDEALALLQQHPAEVAELDELDTAIRKAVTARALLAEDQFGQARELAEQALAMDAARANLALLAALYELRSQARREDEPADADRDLAHAIALLLALGHSDRAAKLSEHFLPDEREAPVRKEDLLALGGLTRPRFDNDVRGPGLEPR